MESLNQEPKFRGFTKEDISTVTARLEQIRKKFSLSDAGTNVEIGEENFRIGNSTEENSPLSVLQLYVTLAASGGTTNIDDIEGEKYKIIGDNLAKNRVLSDLKILDLGCGGHPLFSVIARKFGASVYTVDLLNVDEMVEQYMLDTYLNGRDLKEVRNNHIVGNINDPSLIEVIKSRSGGEFNLVTESHLASGAERGGRMVSSRNGKFVARETLSPRGIYFNANNFGSLIHVSDL